MKKENLADIAAKNSTYTLASIIISKIGGLVLTIILARMLLPELFGIYALALSIAVIATTITDLGSDLTCLRYMSAALGKNNKSKARSYFKFLFKIKGILILIAIIGILLLAKPLAYTVFNKPLVFVPILLSCFYIFFESLRTYLGAPFGARKDLRVFPFLESILHASKIILSLIAISILSYKLKVPGIFIAFAISGFLFLILEVIFLIKRDKEVIFGKTKSIDKKRILKFMGFMGLSGITLAFFSSVDTLMLGRFVDAEYLGYYRVAIGLVLSVSALIPFAGPLLPIFTQIHGKRLERGFLKSLRYTIILTIPMSVGLVLLSNYIIFFIYGKEYLSASSLLHVLSFLILVVPLIALYTTIFQAKEKPNLLAKFIFISLIINIILNYLLIKTFLTISQEFAIIGAGIATLISQIFFLGILIFKTNKQFKIKIDKKPILKSIISAIFMAIFILTFKFFADISIITGAILIVISILIYFSVMFFIKGISEEDILLIKQLINSNKLKNK